ncbi:MAG: hypothetical protein II377_06500 [Clostridia bacterium]|nr:hypothetical protein [Clostridia bacterium]
MLTDLIFYGSPIAAIVFFCISLYRYLSGKSKNRLSPNTVSDSEMQNRRYLLIVSAVIAGIIALLAVGFIGLTFLVLAYM